MRILRKIIPAMILLLLLLQGTVSTNAVPLQSEKTDTEDDVYFHDVSNESVSQGVTDEVPFIDLTRGGYEFSSDTGFLKAYLEFKDTPLINKTFYYSFSMFTNSSDADSSIIFSHYSDYGSESEGEGNQSIAIVQYFGTSLYNATSLELNISKSDNQLYWEFNLTDTFYPTDDVFGEGSDVEMVGQAIYYAKIDDEGEAVEFYTDTLGQGGDYTGSATTISQDLEEISALSNLVNLSFTPALIFAPLALIVVIYFKRDR